jgi:hypothetical protein
MAEIVRMGKRGIVDNFNNKKLEKKTKQNKRKPQQQQNKNNLKGPTVGPC